MQGRPLAPPTACGHVSASRTVSFDGPDGRPLAVVHAPVTRISLQHSGFDANRNVSANIGLGILKQFNLTFDYARQRIILEAQPPLWSEGRLQPGRAPLAAAKGISGP
jgi:hypothetical protein